MKKAIGIALVALVVGAILLPLFGAYAALVVAIVAAFSLLKGVRNPVVIMAVVLAGVAFYVSTHMPPAAPAKTATTTTAPAVVVVAQDDQVGRHVSANVAMRVMAAAKRIAADEKRAAEYAEAKRQQAEWEKSQREAYVRAAAARQRELQLIQDLETAEIVVLRAKEAAHRARKEAERVASYRAYPTLARAQPDPVTTEQVAQEAEHTYDRTWLVYGNVWREARAAGIYRPGLPY